jgi:hypothetical protein
MRFSVVLLTPKESLQIRSRREFQRFCISAGRQARLELSASLMTSTFHISPRLSAAVVVRCDTQHSA